MAPHMQRNYRNTGDPGRYSLRTLKHSDNFLQARDVNVSKVNGKEDFFRCIGLQMRRYQYEYTAPDGGCRVKKINIPNGVVLRDCRVVILGPTCKLCGKCFKCETDMNVHNASKHRTGTKIRVTNVKGTQCTEHEIDAWKRTPISFDRTEILSGNSTETKLHKKLRLTLKIGEEIVAKISMKRKYLKGNMVDMCTQTELNRGIELIASKDGYEGVVSRIDPPVLGNSPCQYCNSSVHTVNSPNQYLVSNIVAGKQSSREESIEQEENYVTNRLKESSTTSASENCGAVHRVPSNTITFESSFTRIDEKCDLCVNDTKDISDMFSSPRSNDASMFNDISYNLRLTEASNSIFHHNRNDDTNFLAETTTDTSLERTVQSCPNDDVERENNKDANENRIENDFNINEKEKCASKNVISNMMPVILPVILPIIVPDKNVPGKSIQLTVESTPSQQQRNGHREEERSNVSRNEHNSDNEIQEVLRIVRKRSSNAEINHESPTRFEQEMLVQDAIRDMKRMEEQGWHLLDKESIDSARKRKRSAKTNDRNSDGECAKKKKKAMVEPNSEYIVRNTTGEENFSVAKEHVAKVQSYSGTVTMCTTDNVKENLMMCNNNIDIPVEVLRRYGINYYNEVFEINNNTAVIQEPVSRFLVPCSGGMENRSNRPVVIDLVNDTDE